MKLVLTTTPSQPIPMYKMKPGQFAWCEEAKTIVFATWMAEQPNQPANNFVSLSGEGSTWAGGCNIPVLLLPPGTQFTLEA